MKISTTLKLYLKSKISSFFTNYVGISTKALLTESRNGTMLIPASDLSLSRAYSKNGGYNLPLVEFISGQTSPTSNILFVGTHVGNILIPLSKVCATTTGIEANPETFSLIKKNLLLNDIHNATLFNLAALDQSGEIEFLKSKENTGGSKVKGSVKSNFEFFYDSPSTVVITAVRLDDILKNQTFELIVIDIEGSEYKALLGMPALLEKSTKLIMEILPNHLKNVARVKPTDFFKAIPPSFTCATPIHASKLKIHYKREEFLDMYQSLEKNYFFDGIDVLFEKTK